MGPFLDVGGHAVSLPAAILLGLVVGYVAGMFGIGGGFLLTPLLMTLFRIPLVIAVGTGLCQVIGTALVALLRHRKLAQGELRVDLMLLPGSLAGTWLGTRLLAWLGAMGHVRIAGHDVPLASLVVDLSYAGVLALAAIVFWRRGDALADALGRARPGPLARLPAGLGVALPTVGIARAPALVMTYIGLALGVLSGLLGIGGGVALMPVLVYGLGFPMRQAAGTGIIVLLAVSTLGTVLHALDGHVDLRLAMALLAGSTITAQLGALATRRLPARLLRRLFALVILATIAAVLWDLARRATAA